MMTKGLFQPLVLAGVLATGFLIGWGVVAFWGAQMYVAGILQPGKNLLFLPDGTPRVAHMDPEYGESRFWDLEGNAVSPPDQASPAMLHSSFLPVEPTNRARVGDTSWEQRIRGFRDGRSPAVYWYFVADGEPNGTAYFVGYDSKSCGCVGYMGMAGLRTGKLPVDERIPFDCPTQEPCSGVVSTQMGSNPMVMHYGSYPEGRAPRGFVSSWDVYVLSRGGKIYHVDLQKRTLRLALEEPHLCSAALVLGVSDPVRGNPYRLVARTDDAVLILDEQGQLLKRYAIPEGLRGQDIHFAETTAGEALMYWNSPVDELATEVDYRIYWVAANGSFREAAITLPWDGEVRQLRTLGAAVVPSPLVLGGLITMCMPWMLREENPYAAVTATYGATLGRMLATFWPALLITQVLAAGLAVLCYRRQVRYQMRGPERVVWPLFVLLLGLPGWIGYRFGRPWPVLESCPECGARVPKNREECACCAADFPGPALKGTEVFA